MVATTTIGCVKGDSVNLFPSFQKLHLDVDYRSLFAGKLALKPIAHKCLDRFAFVAPPGNVCENECGRKRVSSCEEALSKHSRQCRILHRA